MAVLKCKMCGGNLEVAENVTVCECEYCGTQQTLPKTHDEVITNLFNRANNLRSKCEFDKAQKIYEKIVNSDPEESEAYWGIILCKYGIEYVEDPATFKKIPTCHRTQLESVRTDADYAAAIEHADAVQKGVYEKEAEAIDKLQKDILAIVHNEKPFDVFICYKETDENGKRTPDSVIANDIYHQLTAEGFKVFYAAITLEDKLGQAYEPYIFAALNSAKVMLSIGTKPEYFTAVWVRNEWSRFLKLIKNDRSKLLIPCYKDMDAYDLPEEFSHLQAQDMSKIGFINDVIRGIKKVIAKDEPKAAPAQNVTVTQTASANVENLLKRGNLCLEDGKWEEADKFFEQVLNENVEEPRAYLGKLLAELKVSSSARLVDADVKPFEFRNNYEKAIRFGSPEFVEKLKKINLQHKYNIATAYMRKAATPEAYRNAKKLFEEISKFSDAKSKAEECESQAVALECQAEEERKNKIYDSAVSKINSGDTIKVEQAIKEFESIIDWRDSGAKIDKCRDIIKDITYEIAKSRMEEGTIGALNGAKSKFMTISDWKDSAELIEKCKARIAEIEAEEEAKKQEAKRTLEVLAREEELKARKRKRIAIISVIAVVLCGAFAFVFTTVIQPTMKYNDAITLAESGNYTEAITAFENLGGFKDSEEQIAKCKHGIVMNKYDNAVKLAENGDYENAISAFAEISLLTDVKQPLADAKCKYAIELIEDGNYARGLENYKAAKGNNPNELDVLEELIYNKGVSELDNKNFNAASPLFAALENYKDSENMDIVTHIGVLASSADYTSIMEKLSELNMTNLPDVAKKVLYDAAYSMVRIGDSEENYNRNDIAYNIFNLIANYKDVQSHIDKFDYKIASCHYVEKNKGTDIDKNYVYKYDKEGRLIWDGIVGYGYDEQGVITISGGYKVEYNSKNQVVRKYNDDEEILINYDSKGNMTERKLITKYSTYIDKYINEYDENGYLSKITHYNSDGEIYDVERYTYSAEGVIALKEVDYYSYEEVYRTLTYKYQYKNGVIISEIGTSDDGYKVSRIYEYGYIYCEE